MRLTTGATNATENLGDQEIAEGRFVDRRAQGLATVSDIAEATGQTIDQVTAHLRTIRAKRRSTLGRT